MKLFDIILGAITIGLLGEDDCSGLDGNVTEVNNYDYQEHTNESNLHSMQDLLAEKELQNIAKVFIFW